MRRRERYAQAALLLVAGVFAGSTQAQPGSNAAARFDDMRAHVDRAVPELIQEYRVPGVAIAVVDADGFVHVAGYGHTDEAKAMRVRDTTVFEAASLGKPLFAHAILHFEAGPPFDPDRPVVEYLGRPFVGDARGATITGRDFLSHSSGLAFSESEGRRFLAFPPGSKWQYSGLGISVLQQAVEELWSGSLQEYVAQTVTGPLAMESTAYLPPQRVSAILAPGHDRQGRRMPPSAWSSPSASSSLHTSARDYGRFLTAVLGELRTGPDGRTASMLEAQIAVDDALGLWWGLGWAVAQEGPDTVFLHWGSNPGYKSLALGSPQQGLAMVVLTNGDNGLDLARALVPIVFGRRYPFLDFYMLHPDD